MIAACQTRAELDSSRDTNLLLPATAVFTLQQRLPSLGLGSPFEHVGASFWFTDGAADERRISRRCRPVCSRGRASPCACYCKCENQAPSSEKRCLGGARPLGFLGGWAQVPDCLQRDWMLDPHYSAYGLPRHHNVRLESGDAAELTVCLPACLFLRSFGPDLQRCWADEQGPEPIAEAERRGIPFTPVSRRLRLSRGQSRH